MRKRKVQEDIIHNEFGQEIHILNDGVQGEMRIKKYDPSDYIYTGEQWCKDCHVQMEYKDEDKIFVCPICSGWITEGEAEAGEGYPTEAASYDNDFGWNEFDSSFEDDYDEIYD